MPADIEEVKELLRNYLEDLEIEEDGSWGPRTEEGNRVRRVLDNLEGGW